jgi:hypothetical protein
VENAIKLETFHLNISPYLQWLWGHSSPNIPDQGFFDFL